MSSILQNTVSRLRRLVGQDGHGALTDRQLLGRFTETNDEGAFAELVRRHAGLVLGVCQRVLGNVQDAEDAFQATYLVLARKAGSVAWRDSVKNWLHGVAHRIACKARQRNARRRSREWQAGQPQAETHVREAADELRPILDAELAALPARYRAPLILCYLEGRTRDEAAEELGWSIGSVKGRLERGRELLRQRLVRRGLSLSVVLCAGLIPGSGGAAEPTRMLLEAATGSALKFIGLGAGGAVPSQIITLAQGVLSAMLISKLKLSALSLFLLGMLGLGTHVALQAASTHNEGVVASLRIAVPNPVGADIEFVAQRDEKEGKRDKERKASVRGLFVSFDPEKALITLMLVGDGARGEQTYHLAGKEAPFTTTLGEPLRPATVTKGAAVVLTLNELDDVVSVQVAYPTASLVLKSVHAARGAISVAEERGEKTYKVAPGAKLSLLGKPAKLEDYKEGTRVDVTLDFAKETVLAIGVGRRDGDGPPREGPRDGDKGRREVPRDGERPPAKAGRPVFDVNGVITAVNAKEGTIDVLGGGEGVPWIKTFTVPNDMKAQLKLGRVDREMGLNELSKALRVSLNLADDKKTVKSFHVQLPFFRETVKTVDAAGGKVTAGDATYAVDKETTIFVNNKSATLAEVAPGMSAVYYLSADRSRVVLIQAFRGERERE